MYPIKVYDRPPESASPFNSGRPLPSGGAVRRLTAAERLGKVALGMGPQIGSQKNFALFSSPY